MKVSVHRPTSYTTVERGWCKISSLCDPLILAVNNKVLTEVCVIVFSLIICRVLLCRNMPCHYYQITVMFSETFYLVILFTVAAQCLWILDQQE